MDNRERLLRKIAATSTARKIGFGAGGAGTGMIINALLGNDSLASYLLSGGAGTIAGLGAEYGLSALEDKNGWSYPGSITGGSTAQGPIHVPAMDIKVPDVPMDYTGTTVGAMLGLPIAGAKTVRDRWKAHADARFANKARAKRSAAREKLAKQTVKGWKSKKPPKNPSAEWKQKWIDEYTIKDPKIAGKPVGVDYKKIGQYTKVKPKGSLLRSGAKNMLIPIIMGALGFGADYARNAALNRDTGL